MYAALLLCGICIIVFALQAIVPGFSDFFLLNSSLLLYRPWTLLTSIFLHGSLPHVLYNILGLGLFGMILEHIVGKKKFLVIFFSGGFLASLGASFLYDAALGASGAIFAILGTLVVLRPHLQVWVAYVPMPMFVAGFVWAISDLVGLFVPSNVANLAHLVGLAFGVGAGFYLRKEYGERKPKEPPLYVDEKTMEKWEQRYMKERYG